MLIESRRRRKPLAPVAESWRRIEAWLDEHIPAVRATLRPGASEKDLAKFEKLVGRALPEDVRESWLIHDGQRTVPADDEHDVPDSDELLFGYALNALFDTRDRLSHESAFSCWRFWMKAHGGGTRPEQTAELDGWRTSSPADAIRRHQFHAGWLPLATLVDNDHLGVDLDPGPNGVVGQVINFGAKVYNHFVLARSWAQFLADIADELEAGNVARGPDGRVRAIELKEPAGCLLGNERGWSKAKVGSKVLRGGRSPER